MVLPLFVVFGCGKIARVALAVLLVIFIVAFVGAGWRYRGGAYRSPGIGLGAALLLVLLLVLLVG